MWHTLTHAPCAGANGVLKAAGFIGNTLTHAPCAGANATAIPMCPQVSYFNPRPYTGGEQQNWTNYNNIFIDQMTRLPILLIQMYLHSTKEKITQKYLIYRGANPLCFMRTEDSHCCKFNQPTTLRP